MPALYMTPLLRNLTICTTRTFLPKAFVASPLTKNFRNPWPTKGLVKSIRTKAKLYKTFLKNPNTDNENANKTLKNKLTQLIRAAKRIYYDHKLENSKNDLKATWKILDEIINKRSNKLTYPSCFMNNGKPVTDPTAIAINFCKYFTNIGPNLAAKIAPSTANYEDFLTRSPHQSLELQPLTGDEFKEIVKTLATDKPPGVDNISMRVINLSIDLIAEPLTEIINLS